MPQVFIASQLKKGPQKFCGTPLPPFDGDIVFCLHVFDQHLRILIAFHERICEIILFRILAFSALDERIHRTYTPSSEHQLRSFRSRYVCRIAHELLFTLGLDGPVDMKFQSTVTFLEIAYIEQFHLMMRKGRNIWRIPPSLIEIPRREI